MIGILVRTLGLFTVGGVLGLVLNTVRAEPIAMTVQAPEAVCEGTPAASPVAELSPEIAAPLCADPSVLILDVRPEEDFAAGHVAGALHLPCREDELGGNVEGQLAAATTILVYGRGTDDARPVAESLARRHPDVRVIAGGFGAWEGAGQACSSGPCVECHGEGL